MLKEISTATEEARVRQHSSRGLGFGYVDILREAERNNKLADPELVANCMKLIDGYIGKIRTISKEHFDEGCDYLDEVAEINSRANQGK